MGIRTPLIKAKDYGDPTNTMLATLAINRMGQAVDKTKYRVRTHVLEA